MIIENIKISETETAYFLEFELQGDKIESIPIEKNATIKTTVNNVRKHFGLDPITKGEYSDSVISEVILISGEYNNFVLIGTNRQLHHIILLGECDMPDFVSLFSKICDEIMVDSLLLAKEK